MLAMCVRKTGDTGGNPTLQSSLTTSSNGPSKRTKHRGLKTLRGRVAVGKQQVQVQPEEVLPDTRHASTAHVDVACTVKVRDDAEGHLIYHKGDHVDSRCKFITNLCLHVH